MGDPRPRTIRLVLEYDGAGFAGWQAQAGGQRTVQDEVARALESVTGERPALHAAGRTDAGAHAEGQVVSFAYAGRLAPARLAAALNARLPADVAVLDAADAPLNFHARHSARWRRYRYRWLDRRARPALDRDRCWHLPGPLDVAAMDRAARALAGRHDWTTFCAASEPAADRVRTLRDPRVERRGRFVELDVTSEGFLRGQVRSIAGALAEVGRGRQPEDWPARLLAARDRRLAPRTAPAGGLTLAAVLYD